MKFIDSACLDGLRADAEASPRRRAHLNLHADPAEPVNRLVIALEPDSYVRPHRHTDKFELFVLISGRCRLLVFAESGKVDRRVDLGGEDPRIAEFPAGAWHSLVALAAGTVVLEVKPGPYSPTSTVDFAAWAPPEGGVEAAACREWMRTEAVVGAQWRAGGDAPQRHDSNVS